MGAACAVLFLLMLIMYIIGLTGCAQSTEVEYQNYYIWEQMGVM